MGVQVLSHEARSVLETVFAAHVEERVLASRESSCLKYFLTNRRIANIIDVYHWTVLRSPDNWLLTSDGFAVPFPGNDAACLCHPDHPRIRSPRTKARTKPGGSVRGERANFTRLVLGCIEAKFCK